MKRDNIDMFIDFKRKGFKPKKFDGVSMTKKVDYRPVSKPKNNKASNSRDDTIETSTSTQTRMTDNVVKSEKY